MKLVQAKTPSDFKKIQAMAKDIWPEVYKDVIPPEQIAFLLEKYFSFKGLDKYRKDGYKYFFVDDGKEYAGFMAFKEYKDFIYLDKLYILKEKRHQHLGGLCFDYLSSTYRKDIRLNVNQNNKNAVQAYLASGFEVLEKQTIPLPGGMVNCDYVMVRRLNNSKL